MEKQDPSALISEAALTQIVRDVADAHDIGSDRRGRPIGAPFGHRPHEDRDDEQLAGDTAVLDLTMSQLNYSAGQNSMTAPSSLVSVPTRQNPHHRNSDPLRVPLTGALVAGTTQRAFTQRVVAGTMGL